jgi:lysophospholipase L1-like esterase
MAGGAIVLICAVLLGAGWWLWNVRSERTRALEQAHSASSLQSCEVQFVGGSAIEFWSRLAGDMAPLQVANLGIGGATIEDVANQFTRSEQLLMEGSLEPSGSQGSGSLNGKMPSVGDEAPQAIVFYAGENDIEGGVPAQAVQARFERFLDLKSERFGDTPVYFISIKPTPARWGQRAVQAELNQSIQALVKERSDLHFIDIVPAMLVQGKPGPFYVSDGVHLNVEGYGRWTPIVRQALDPFIKRQQAGECRARGEQQ